MSGGFAVPFFHYAYNNLDIVSGATRAVNMAAWVEAAPGRDREEQRAARYTPCAASPAGTKHCVGPNKNPCLPQMGLAGAVMFGEAGNITRSCVLRLTTAGKARP